MKLLAISCTILLLLSCQAGNHSQADNSSSLQDSLILPLGEEDAGQVSNISFNPELDRIKTPWRGDMINSAVWDDKNGRNTLIISGLEADVESERAELFAYLYVEKSGQTEKLWQINDFVTGQCDRDIYPIPGSLEIMDLNEDGVAENLFMYILADNCDATPVNTKLMMHSGEEKLVIRGLTKVFLLPTPEVTAEAKIFDPAFDQTRPIFKAYASKKWDDYVEKETQAFREAMGE